MSETIPRDQRIRYAIDGGVADVRLARPEKMNALDTAMFEHIIDVGLELAANPAVRAVVLSGDGRAFCAGLDFDRLREMRGGTRRPPTDRPPLGPAVALAQQTPYVWTALPVPVIAAVHGVAFGGGLQIALNADIRIAHPQARLSVMEMKWGLVPDMTGTQVLAGLVRRDLAKELVYTGRIVGGVEAAEIGLVTRTAEDPHAAAMALAREIAGKSPDAVRRAKELTEISGRVPLADGFAAEQSAIRDLIGTPNQAEAVAANLEQRAPVFTDVPPA